MKWKPKVGEQYWVIAHLDCVEHFDWEPDNEFDVRHYKIGNCYRTKKEAMQALRRVKKALRGEE